MYVCSFPATEITESWEHVCTPLGRPHLRNKTWSPCLHSLVKTEANVWENLRADQIQG